MTTEHALKEALAPLASAALASGVDLVCVLDHDVGEYVLGERRQFMDVVARAVAPAISAAATRGEVCVRVARQRAGFDPTDKVLVSVSTRHLDSIEDGDDLELTLPIAQRLDDVEGVRVLAGTRVLLVVPSLHLASVHRVAVRRFGAIVESMHDVGQARDQLHAAAQTGAPVDILYLDDRAPHVTELLRELRDDASVHNVRGVVGTALPAGAARDAYLAAGAALTLSKPLLPFELRDAIIQLRAASRETSPPPSTGLAAPISTAVERTRRASGMRRIHLAGVLASLAIGVEPRRG